MANSGIVWIDTTFNWAVYALVWLGNLLGITYEEINVWLFVIAWPLVTVLMGVIIWQQLRELQLIRKMNHTAM
ncbi:MAG: hypothetical protein HQ508_00710 [Candidatus Marinimicrobia bacterium]|nr:hypothetical protein [Candidatus Neomarinimicrobiota bacterium]